MMETLRGYQRPLKFYSHPNKSNKISPGASYSEYEKATVVQKENDMPEPIQKTNINKDEMNNIKDKTDVANMTDDEIVSFMENNYPIMTQEFKDVQRENYMLFLRKQYNYGPDNISLGTTLENETDRKVSLMGLWFRVNDKINRLKGMLLFGKADLVGEGVSDTLQDVAVYGVINQIVQRGKWGK
ncbi:hypothetical protein [Microcystis phage Mel-JY01]